MKTERGVPGARRPPAEGPGGHQELEEAGAALPEPSEGSCRSGIPTAGPRTRTEVSWFGLGVWNDLLLRSLETNPDALTLGPFRCRLWPLRRATLPAAARHCR